MENIGRTLGTVAEAGDVIVLTGELGAGKTTFTRGFAEALEVQTPVTSPTFIVARTHQRTSPAKPPLVHIDAYRLGQASELEDLDIDVANSIVVAEWAAPYISVVSPHWLEIRIERPRGALSEGSDLEEPRQLSVSVHGSDSNRYARYTQALAVA
jgi:tRNA threonylcarbamoyl adenosine modification protein YjeE